MEAHMQDSIAEFLNSRYNLEMKDAISISRLSLYSMGKLVLTKKEIDEWIHIGVVDPKTKSVNIDPLYVENDVVAPAFWIKCLLAKYGMLNFAFLPKRDDVVEKT